MTVTPDPHHPVTDSHCHLDFPDFEGQVGSFVDAAVAAGVHRMVTICTSLAQEPKVRAIAEAHAPVFYAAGVHPMRAAEDPLVTVDQLTALADHPKFVGIAKPGWITIILPKAPKCSKHSCACISRPAARPACR